MLHHVLKRFLGNPKEEDGSAGAGLGLDVVDGTSVLHSKTVTTLHFLAETCQRARKASSIDQRGMELMGKSPEKRTEVVELLLDRTESLRWTPLRLRRVGYCSALFANQNHALNGVVMHFPGYPSALLLLGFQDLPSMGAMQIQIATLKKHDRDRSSREQYHGSEHTADEYRPNG